jgi:hypothetical protein
MATLAEELKKVQSEDYQTKLERLKREKLLAESAHMHTGKNRKISRNRLKKSRDC